MRVLLTNDDGIHAPGLRALAEAMRGAGHRVWVCAPHVERSAASHSAVIGKPLHASRVAYDGVEAAWQTDGTPADCARLGIYLTRDENIDMVVAGINRGMNLGGACVYSGTVAAAMEASMCGVPALAVSLHIPPMGSVDEDYGPAGRLAVRVAEWAIDRPLPRGCLYNLNVPTLPYEAIRGLVPAKLASVFLSEAAYRKETDDRGDCYRYVYHEVPLRDPDDDMVRIEEGYATITKLTWDMRMPGDDSDMAKIGL